MGTPDAVMTAVPWVDMAIRSLREISQTLGLGACEVLERPLTVRDEKVGAAISLEGEGVEIWLHISAHEGDLIVIARRFLKIAPGANLRMEDATDAMCELSNMLAGGIKAGMRRRVRGLRITLPNYGELPKPAPAAMAVIMGLGGCALHVRLTPEPQ